MSAVARGAGSYLSNLGVIVRAGETSSAIRLFPADDFGNAVQTSTGQTIVFTMTLSGQPAMYVPPLLSPPLPYVCR
jgi:hypothetical protein